MDPLVEHDVERGPVHKDGAFFEGVDLLWAIGLLVEDKRVVEDQGVVVDTEIVGVEILGADGLLVEDEEIVEDRVAMEPTGVASQTVQEELIFGGAGLRLCASGKAEGSIGVESDSTILRGFAITRMMALLSGLKRITCESFRTHVTMELPCSNGVLHIRAPAISGEKSSSADCVCARWVLHFLGMTVYALLSLVSAM